MPDDCNSTTAAPPATTAPSAPSTTVTPATPASPSTPTSTPGVVAGFTPSLNGPASTVTQTTNHTATVEGPGTTITRSSDKTVTKEIYVAMNKTSSSTPRPTKLCGTAIATTLPNGKTITMYVGSSTPAVTKWVKTTLNGGSTGLTTTIPRKSYDILGWTIGQPFVNTVVTVHPSSETLVTVLETFTPPPSSDTVESSAPGSSAPASSTTITVDPGSTTTVTIPPSTTAELVSTPTVSVLKLIGGVVGLTTKLPELPTPVHILPDVTSLITLSSLVPLPTPDVETLVGGLAGMTTILPPLETPGLLDLPGLDNPLDNPLDNLPLTTDIISAVPTDVGGITPPTAEILGVAARPTVALAAGAVGVGALGLAAFVL